VVVNAIPVPVGLEIRICLSVHGDRSKTGFVRISHEKRQMRALLHLTAEANQNSSEANTGGEQPSASRIEEPEDADASSYMETKTWKGVMSISIVTRRN
jgi:hypothetical protein